MCYLGVLVGTLVLVFGRVEILRRFLSECRVVASLLACLVGIEMMITFVNPFVSLVTRSCL